ncbi:MAG: regulatory protein RecX [Lachnospiraceae bacterium]
MIVTNIITLQKKKVLIELDEHLVLPIYSSEVRKYDIILGKELSNVAQVELLGEIIPKRAKLRAMHLLTKRSYTEHALRTKLLEGKYPDELVEEAIAYVKSYGYIDDIQYIRDYISTYSETKSKMKIQMDLYKKGISKGLFDDVWTENSEIDSEDYELQQIKRWIEKKKFSYEEASPKERQSMINYLFRKGYSLEKIRCCIQIEDIF